MSANLCSENYEKTIVNGFVQHRLTRTYKVDTGTNIVTTTQDSGLPQVGSQIVIEGQVYYLVTKSARRLNDEGGRILSYVDCIYDNDAGRFDRDTNGNPVTNPENIAPYVQAQYNEEVEEISDARLIGIEDPNGNYLTLPPILADRSGTSRKYPITNSAGVPAGLAQKKKHSKQITYWTYHRTWNDNWETYVDNINSAAFTITQRDKHGIRLQYNVAVRTGLLADIIKEDHWKGDGLYFRRGLVILIDPRTWVHRQPDVSFSGAVFNGQYDWEAETPTQFTQDQLSGMKINATRTAIYRTFKDSGGDFVPEPVRLNGYGAPHWTPRPGAPPAEKDITFNVVYDKYEVSDYATALSIS